MYVFWCSSNIYTYIYICVYVIVSFKKMDHDNINNDIQTICNIQYVHSCFDVVSSWYQHTPRPRWNLDAKASFMLRSLPNAWGFCCMLPKSSRCLYQFGKCVFATSPRSSNKKHTKIIANFSEKRTQDKHDLVLKISFEKVRNEKKKHWVVLVAHSLTRNGLQISVASTRPEILQRTLSPRWIRASGQLSSVWWIQLLISWYWYTIY